jgi:hypothetical protein
VDGVADETAVFFLEANNWQLQNALASYFENGGNSSLLRQQPQMQIIEEVRVVERVWRRGTISARAWMRCGVLALTWVSS